MQCTQYCLELPESISCACFWAFDSRRRRRRRRGRRKNKASNGVVLRSHILSHTLSHIFISLVSTKWKLLLFSFLLSFTLSPNCVHDDYFSKDNIFQELELPVQTHLAWWPLLCLSTCLIIRVARHLPSLNFAFWSLCVFSQLNKLIWSFLFCLMFWFYFCALQPTHLFGLNIVWCPSTHPPHTQKYALVVDQQRWCIWYVWLKAIQLNTKILIRILHKRFKQSRFTDIYINKRVDEYGTEDLAIEGRTWETHILE